MTRHTPELRLSGSRRSGEARLRFWLRARSKLGELVARGVLSLDERDRFDGRLTQVVSLPSQRDLALVGQQLREHWQRAAGLVALSA